MHIYAYFFILCAAYLYDYKSLNSMGNDRKTKGDLAYQQNLIRCIKIEKTTNNMHMKTKLATQKSQ